MVPRTVCRAWPTTGYLGRWVCLGALAAAVCLGSGCGSSGPPTGKISGTVTFEGQPVPEGEVCFSCPAQGVFINAPLARDGTYVVTTAKGAGLPTGKYQVAVTPPPPLVPVGTIDHPLPVKPYPNIPQKYRDPQTSRLELMVEQKDNQFDIQMSR